MGVTQFTLLQITDAGSNGADIQIGQPSKPGTAYAGTSNDYRIPILGNYTNLTLAHEPGHSLGLKHSQEAGGVANTAVPPDRDDLEFTIMSYRAYVGASSTAAYGFEQFGAPQSFLMLDIAALQQRYGVHFGYRASDTTYRWNALTGKLSVDGIGRGQQGANRVFETLWDGGGHDTYVVGATTVLVMEAASAGTDQVLASVSYTLTDNVDTLTLTGSANIGGGGIALANALTGNVGANRLAGGDGNDTLLGNAGDDTLDGGTDADSMTGGLGNNCYVVDALGDVVLEAANAGTGMVLTSIARTLGDKLETRP